MQSYFKLAGVGYFGSGVALSATTFFGPMLKERGFSPENIGFLTSSFEISLLTIMPLTLFIVDKYGGLRWLLTLNVALSTVLLCLACLAEDATMTAVWVVLFLLVLAPAPRLWDRTVLQVLGKQDAQDWGHYRLMQSVFFGAGAPACAALKHLLGWIAVPIQFTFGYALILIAPHYYHHSGSMVPPAPRASSSVDISHAIRVIRSDRFLWVFLLSNTMLGIPFAVIQYFLPVVIKDLQGGNTYWVGISTATTTATEALVFLASAHILKHISLQRVYLIGLVAMVVRLAGYAVVTEPWMVLPVDLLHGASFAATWLACVQVYSIRMPDELAATGFGILSMFSYGIGPFVGNICGGIIFSKLSARVMFLSACGWTCLLIVLFVVLAPRISSSCSPQELRGSDAIVNDTTEASPLVV